MRADVWKEDGYGRRSLACSTNSVRYVLTNIHAIYISSGGKLEAT